MNRCFKCGISDEQALLMDVICNGGIKKICRKCSFGENLPLIRKPNIMKLREPEKRKTVYERLSKVAGIEPDKPPVKKKELKEQETTLKEIIDKRFENQVSSEKKNYSDLIDNFHWALMRVRRLKKLTVEQLAKEINESSQVLRMAEKGFLGANYLVLMKKLENYFGFKFIKDEFAVREKKPIEVVDSNLLGKPEMIFDKGFSNELKISDLKNMKKGHEEKIFEKEEYVFNENVNEDIEVPEFIKKESVSDNEDETLKIDSKKDLTQEEINKILFGKNN